MNRSLGLGRFSAGLLIYTLVVIVWGAFVRISFSGDGCGIHWPLCDGQILPAMVDSKTLIEFVHRISSGIIGPLSLGLLYWCHRVAPKKSQLRKSALAVVALTITEGLIGAQLVLKSYVAGNATAERALWGGIHLVNTFFLLAAMTMVVWLAFGKPQLRLKGQGPAMTAIVIGLVGVLLMGVTGAIAALGNMVDHSAAASLAEGIRKDFDPSSHFLVRLRLSHPLIATSVGVYVVFLMSYLTKVRPAAEMRKLSNLVVGIFAFQMVFGVANLVMQRPLLMALGHLLVADVLWIALILACAQALNKNAEVVLLAEPTTETPEPTPVMEPAVPLWKAYIELTKPRVISLLLFTTVTAAFIAAKGWPGGWLLVAITLGGYAAAGAANAINMVYDRDIDIRMERTAKRPTVTHRISSANALLFALVLESFSFVLLWSVCNLLSAVMALAGLLFYVFIYTMALKRRTWHNIVIGGAAGAFPPLVGYSAVTGSLSPLAWVLFAIIFLWTPVHFWALALLIKDDYRAAGIPMLPVVRGERATVLQIALYTVLTVIVSLLPLLMGQSGPIYLVAALALNAVLFVRTFQLVQAPDNAKARTLFKYSMVYLAALFLMIAIDRGVLS